MFDQESAFLLRAGFGKMAAFDSFSDVSSKSNFYRKATTLNVRQDIFGKLNRQAHVGQVLFILLRRVLDSNSRVLGDGLFAVEVSYNKRLRQRRQLALGSAFGRKKSRGSGWLNFGDCSVSTLKTTAQALHASQTFNSSTDASSKYERFFSLVNTRLYYAFYTSLHRKAKRKKRQQMSFNKRS